MFGDLLGGWFGDKQTNEDTASDGLSNMAGNKPMLLNKSVSLWWVLVIVAVVGGGIYWGTKK